ncbi:hypothetical protein HID58_004546 [Brassica napus]|uniref:Uncharacterized protein n=1 Tax=Brassica napus TaxID=3708 RepID=A0ABQ8E631_BRANA|nr:hypothetical protein HID58_004546 [Brassica napus]
MVLRNHIGDGQAPSSTAGLNGREIDLRNSEPYIDGAGTEPDHVIRTTVRGWIIIENVCKKYGIPKKFTFMCSNLM